MLNFARAEIGYLDICKNVAKLMMKGLLLTLVLLIWDVNCHAQLVDETEFRNLLGSKKYNSAFQLLNKADPKNEDPDIVLKKVDLALNYFAQSISHQMFAFKDLEEGESLSDVRTGQGEYSIYPFAINTILDSLISIYPNNGKLHKALGNFYYEVHLKYGQNWLESNEVVLKKMNDHCLNAIELKSADYLTHYCVGYYHTLIDQYHQAIDCYLNSIKADSTFPTSYYNLAICYLYDNRAQEGISYVKKSIELYHDVNYKSDAARVTATLYKEVKDYPNAELYYLLSDSILPENYYTLNQLLEVQLLQGKMKHATKSAEQFFSLDPTNPKICSDLLEIYTIAEKENDLISFLNKMAKQNEENFEVAGNVYFHLGAYYFRREKEEEAKKYFKLARTNFEKVFEPDHAVFKQIDGVLNEE